MPKTDAGCKVNEFVASRAVTTPSTLKTRGPQALISFKRVHTESHGYVIVTVYYGGGSTSVSGLVGVNTNVGEKKAVAKHASTKVTT